jgi:very-short-patch-repair endonuclease
MLDELERISAALFPLWLPGADRISGARGAGVPAVRSMAHALAARSEHFGPFLADLAERSLRGAPGGGTRFAQEVRAAGLARVVAASYRRPGSAILVEVPAGLVAADERALIAAVEWIAHHGGFAVWLIGAPPNAVDRVDTIAVELPDQIAAVGSECARWTAPPHALDRPMSFLPPTGSPHPGSLAEMALEKALAVHPWAAGRVWNQTYQSHPLANTFRLDLLWAAERLVVEIDGPDHCGAAKYAADRRRDVQLTIDGFTVVRFTNAHVLDDVRTVVSQLERLLGARRI